MSKQLKGTKTHQNLKDAFAGESQANRRYLYFAKVADVEGYPDVAGLLQGHRRRRDRPRARPPRLPEAGRRSGDRPADRQHREEPQGRRRRRDARVRDDVPGHGEDRARRGLRRHRRVVRDARQGREVPRRPLPEGARHARTELASTRALARDGRRVAVTLRSPRPTATARAIPIRRA